MFQSFSVWSGISDTWGQIESELKWLPALQIPPEDADCIVSSAAKQFYIALNTHPMKTVSLYPWMVMVANIMTEYIWHRSPCTWLLIYKAYTTALLENQRGWDRLVSILVPYKLVDRRVLLCTVNMKRMRRGQSQHFWQVKHWYDSMR